MEMVDYQLLEFDEKNELLKRNNMSIQDDSYQLKTNRGSVYHLPDSTVLFVPGSHHLAKCILFSSEKAFQEVLKNDKFPVDNPWMSICDTEENYIRDIYNHIDRYNSYVCKYYKQPEEEIGKSTIQKYLDLIDSGKKKKREPMLVLSFLFLVGEIVRQERSNMVWGANKYYREYNPTYFPVLVENQNTAYFFYDRMERFFWLSKTGYLIQSQIFGRGDLGSARRFDLNNQSISSSIVIF